MIAASQAEHVGAAEDGDDLEGLEAMEDEGGEEEEAENDDQE